MSLPSPTFWIVHAASSLVVTGLALGVGKRLHARLRLSHAARGYWTGIWLLATLPPLLVAILQACLPGAAGTLPLALPLPIAIDQGLATPGVATMLPIQVQPSLPLAAMLACVYATGLGIVLLRWLRSSAVIANVVRSARPIDPAAWPGMASAAEAARLAQSGVSMRATTRSITPFAVRWPRPTIVLPIDTLAQMGDAGLRLVIRHEAAHLMLRDPQRSLLMSAIGALLWFNPFVRRIAARVQMASELCCDAHAINGDAAARRALADAYLHTLRKHASMTVLATVLNPRGVAGHSLRIRHMLHGDANRMLSRASGMSLTGLGAAAIGLMSLLQLGLAAPATAAHSDPATSSRSSRDEVLAAAPPAEATSFRLDPPLAQPRITGRFGDTGSIRARPHRGTDFGTRVGTPVFAPAAGIVVAATTQYPDGPDYGTVVVLDHGNGWQTLYAHLDGFDVRVGQHVEAGERIAQSGRSGRVTGPHLHLEALRDGQRVDPERLLQ
ncbi:M23/M56 family metallopeptidase [Stenotrophomonas sp. MMGLT7]|uniref:M23/M56 family metallopeptidase n=1 Tax=Stenotrophomonas sp. MMGLT7 TaxID=2901227 RepID=UPI001E4CE6D1|nr:M23/M56 family metallopeptidase [Stenotrophomonas sp. MMGLT7]MCD7097962.1 M23/M56 family metallopeptidase [Stenotrophomonas sp. MMGLT7]